MFRKFSRFVRLKVRGHRKTRDLGYVSFCVGNIVCPSLRLLHVDHRARRCRLSLYLCRLGIGVAFFTACLEIYVLCLSLLQLLILRPLGTTAKSLKHSFKLPVVALVVKKFFLEMLQSIWYWWLLLPTAVL